MTLFIMSGMPGSSKSTWADAYGRKHGIQVVSSDRYRIMMIREYYPEANHFTDVPDMPQELIDDINRELWKMILGMLIAACREGRDIIMDAVTVHERYVKRYASIAEKFGRDWRVIVMNTPYYGCLVRNGLRDRTVPLEVMESMHSDFVGLWERPNAIDCRHVHFVRPEYTE